MSNVDANLKRPFYAGFRAFQRIAKADNLDTRKSKRFL
jgi:hypothetical protein